MKRGCEMSSVKISSKMDEDVWNALKALAEESHQSISGLLTDAAREYLARRRVRPAVMEQVSRSMDENEELGKLLAK